MRPFLVLTASLFIFAGAFGQQSMFDRNITNKAEVPIGYKNSYYITLNNDTVRATIEYTNIANLQHELDIVEPGGTIKTFYPGEIKGFWIKDTGAFFFATNKSKVSDKKEFRKVSHGESKPYPYYIKTQWDQPVNLYFESVSVDDSLKLFMNVIYGDKGPLHYLNYYYVYHPDYHKSLTGDTNHILGLSVALIDKGNRLFYPGKGEGISKENLWLSRAISDDTLLSDMVKSKKFNLYFGGSDIEMIVNEYNNWRASPNKADTSLIEKGILDADKYYRPSLFLFLGSAAGTAAFLLPGIVFSGITERPIKEKSLHIPANSNYLKNDNYITGYKMRAGYKKIRNIARGLGIGLIVFVPVFIVTYILTNK